MLRSFFKILFFLSVFLLFTTASNADPQIGRLLEEAMEARNTGTVSLVTDKFMTAADAAASYNQRANILFIFSDYLLDKHEWEKVIHVQRQIIDCGRESSQAAACYNLVRANLELNRIDEARKAAVELNACPAKEAMREHAATLKEIAPDSIHARISDLLAEAALSSDSSVSVPLQMQSLSCVQISAGQQTASFTNDTQVLPEVKLSAPANEGQSSLLIGGWNSALQGNLDSQGMSLDFGGDLSSKRETSLVMTVETSPKPENRFRATYVNFSFGGTLNKTYVHNGKTYNPGAEFRLRSKFIDLEGYHELSQRPRMAWGVLYGFVMTDSDLEISQNVPGLCQITTWDSRFGYPYLGMAARSNHGGSIGWEASGKVFVWNGAGRYQTHDLELKLLFGQGSRKLSSERKFWGYLGYRDFCWDGDFDDARIELGFSGPVLGLEFFF